MRMVLNTGRERVAIEHILPVYYVHYQAGKGGTLLSRRVNLSQMLERMEQDRWIDCEYDVDGIVTTVRPAKGVTIERVIEFEAQICEEVEDEATE